ncbi:MAG: hypothetical protein AAB332_00270, partial [Planctomycetota bacterium]
DPPVRFGGRGGESLPYPYLVLFIQRRIAKLHHKGGVARTNSVCPCLRARAQAMKMEKVLHPSS